MKRYTVVFEPIEDGWWMASIPAVQGVRTQGRSINEARKRVREALGLAAGHAVAEQAKLVDQVQLPQLARRALQRVKKERVRLEVEEQKAKAITRSAVWLLTKKLGLSVRDAGELLGLSHQRIHQIAQAK